MKDRINGIEYFRVLKNKWHIWVPIFVVAELVCLIVTLMKPEIYESTASILLPSVENRVKIITSGLPNDFRGELPSNLYSEAFVSHVITAMLRSKRMARDIVEKFDLINFYRTKSTPKTTKRLQEQTDISISNEGIISITVKTIEPRLASEIANFYIENLYKMNDELKITSLIPISTFLDPALPAEYPVSPMIAQKLLITGILSLFIGILISFLINYVAYNPNCRDGA